MIEDSVQLKIDRARRHLAEYTAAIEAHRQRTPYSITAVDNPERGQRELRVTLNHELPPLGLIVGDIIHNLRSALDHLMCRLVEANGAKVTPRTLFPVAPAQRDWKSVRNNRAKGASQAVHAALDALAPYPEGNTDLWDLHRLDIADKHHLLLAAAAAQTHVRVDTLALIRNMMPDSVVFSENLEIPNLKLRAAEPVPMEDGAVVYAGPLGDTSVDHTAIDVQWVLVGKDSNGQPVLEPIAPLVERLGNAVDNAVAALKPLL